MNTTQALVASADRLVFDPVKLKYVLDGRTVNDTAVEAALAAGVIERVPWTLRHRKATP